MSSVFGLLASSGVFDRPAIDWHAVAPELCLLGGGALLTLMDVIWLEKGRAYTAGFAGIIMLIPIIRSSPLRLTLKIGQCSEVLL